MKYIFGIDIGGTTCKIGFFDLEGNQVSKWEVPTDKSLGGSNIIKDILKSCKNYLLNSNILENDVIGYGFGIPGSVKNNIVNKCVNIGWGVVDFQKECKKYLESDKLVICNNDANVACYGEVWQGNAKGITSAVMLTLGTGVGSGVIIDNKIIEGENGAAGELGHIFIDDKFNFLCNCGKYGCLETVASATGIVKIAQYYLERKMYKTNLLNDNELTSKKIFDFAKMNDELALKVVEEVGRYLGIACANISCTIDPTIFIIGGGVSNAGQILLDEIKKNYIKYCFHASKNTKFVLAKLKNDAGIYGAAYLVKMAYKNKK